MTDFSWECCNIRTYMYISHTHSFHVGVSTMQLSGSISAFWFTVQVFGSGVQNFTDCCTRHILDVSQHNSFYLLTNVLFYQTYQMVHFTLYIHGTGVFTVCRQYTSSHISVCSSLHCWQHTFKLWSTSNITCVIIFTWHFLAMLLSDSVSAHLWCSHVCLEPIMK